MDLFKSLMKIYNEEYNQTIKKNMPLLVEAFTTYYGEEYRERIKYVFDHCIISWEVSSLLTEFYNEFLKKVITKDHLEVTTKILGALSIGSGTFAAKIVQPGDITVSENGISIFPGSVEKVKDSLGRRYDNVLEYLYGKDRLFNYDFENDCIYNFYSLSFEEQEQFLGTVFGVDELDDEIIERIDTAIRLMNVIKNNRIGPNRSLYSDFALVANYIGAEPKIEVVGSLDNKIFEEKYEEVLSDENSSTIVEDHSVSVAYDEILNEEAWVIFSSILLISDESFISVLNGALQLRILAFLGEDSQLEKYGLYVSDDTKEDEKISTYALQEIVLKFATVEITNIFHDLGGSIFDTWTEAYDLVSCGRFESYYPLVADFYEKYKELLKKVCIGYSRDELFREVDEQGFYRYVSYLNNFIAKTPANMVMIDKKTKKHIRELLFGMEKRSDDRRGPALKRTIPLKKQENDLN